jgi:CheY-like chemotaxis protein
LVQGHNRSEEKPCRTSEEEGSPTASGGEFLDFSVEDTGLGISAEALGRLFQPFTQASSAVGRSFGGTGLGLSISRRLAEAMNGTVTVTSTLGKGSIFTLRLPLEVSFPAPSIPTPAVPVHSEPAALAGDLILVVDDDRASGVVAVKMLQNLGHRVEFVTNGAEAIEAFSPGKYSAILMDVAMPVMDGLVATGKIREIEAASGCHVPIIAFTANVTHGDQERCLAAGMDDFLSKPFKKAELAAKLACVKQGSLPQDPEFNIQCPTLNVSKEQGQKGPPRDSGEHTRPACGGRRPADRIEPFRSTGLRPTACRHSRAHGLVDPQFHVPGGTPGTTRGPRVLPGKTARPRDVARKRDPSGLPPIP